MFSTWTSQKNLLNKHHYFHSIVRCYCQQWFCSQFNESIHRNDDLVFVCCTFIRHTNHKLLYSVQLWLRVFMVRCWILPMHLHESSLCIFRRQNERSASNSRAFNRIEIETPHNLTPVHKNRISNEYHLWCIYCDYLIELQHFVNAVLLLLSRSLDRRPG